MFPLEQEQRLLIAKQQVKYQDLFLDHSLIQLLTSLAEPLPMEAVLIQRQQVDQVINMKEAHVVVLVAKVEYGWLK
jgi:hypothetical protein